MLSYELLTVDSAYNFGCISKKSDEKLVFSVRRSFNPGPGEGGGVTSLKFTTGVYR